MVQSYSFFAIWQKKQDMTTRDAPSPHFYAVCSKPSADEGVRVPGNRKAYT